MEQIDIFTERYKFKDIVAEMEKSEQKGVKKDLENLKELTKNIAKEYNLKEDDIEFIRKKNPLKAEDVKIEDGERAAIRYINTADVDRDNEIVMPDGGLVKDFQKSMTVLYAHNYSDLPIGRDLWIKLIKGKGWLAKTLYAEHQKAADVYNLVKDHFLNTSSIGFIPLESITPDNKGWDKVKAKLVDIYGIKEKLIDNVRRIYTKWLLLEHSDVPIPSNINALNIAVGKGYIKSEDILKDLQDEIEIIESIEKEEIIVEGTNEKGEKVKETIEIKDIITKPEETEDFIHIPVIDAGKFVKDSFRTIDIDKKKGIKAVIGKLKTDPEGKTKVQKFIFDKRDPYKWTMKRALAWVKEHGKSISDYFENWDVKGTIEEIDWEKVKENIFAGEKIGFNLDEIYEIVKENKELTAANILLNKLNEELELKAGAVLNKKNKSDLIEGQKRIQNVLDSATSEEGKTTYNCECIKCGYKVTTDKHCDTFKCPKCGGKMRRQERPGPGKELEIDIEDEKADEIIEIEDKKKEDIELSSEEIKDIIVQAIGKNVKEVKEGINKRIDDNFKKVTGKVV